MGKLFQSPVHITNPQINRQLTVQTITTFIKLYTEPEKFQIRKKYFFGQKFEKS